MMKNRLLLAAVIVLGTAFSVHVYAHLEKLYWHVWWLDIPMHFFGGVGGGFLGLWAALVLGLLPLTGRRADSFGSATISWKDSPHVWSLGCALVATAIIGLAWEVLEVFLLAYSGYAIPAGYIPDTTLDLIMDAVGATTAWWIFYRVQWETWQKVTATS